MMHHRSGFLYGAPSGPVDKVVADDGGCEGLGSFYQDFLFRSVHGRPEKNVPVADTVAQIPLRQAPRKETAGSPLITGIRTRDASPAATRRKIREPKSHLPIPRPPKALGSMPAKSAESGIV
jgi:hypothetical protein